MPGITNGFVAPEKPNALTELRARRFQWHEAEARQKSDDDQAG